MLYPDSAWCGCPGQPLEPAPTPAIALPVQKPASGPDVVQFWPFPQKWPGAAPTRRLHFHGAGADPNEHGNRSRTDSPESVLEVPPTAPIAV